MQMKKTILLFMMIGALMIGVLASTQNSYSETGDKTYFVVFENGPEITSNTIYASEAPIGEVLSKEPSKNSTVILKIQIMTKFDDLLTEDTVFFAEGGSLNYFATLGDGHSLPTKGKMLGFTSKKDVYWFKATQRHKENPETPAQIAERLYNQATR